MSEPERNRKALRLMFEAVLEAPELDEEAVARHFSPAYVQRVGDVELDYQGFIDHMRAQKRAIAETKITIEHLVAEGDAVCSVHHIDARKQGGGEVAGQVIAYWSFDRDGLIVACKELTQISAGDPADRDLGSRT